MSSTIPESPDKFTSVRSISTDEAVVDVNNFTVCTVTLGTLVALSVKIPLDALSVIPETIRASAMADASTLALPAPVTTTVGRPLTVS